MKSNKQIRWGPIWSPMLTNDTLRCIFPLHCIYQSLIMPSWHMKLLHTTYFGVNLIHPVTKVRRQMWWEEGFIFPTSRHPLSFFIVYSCGILQSISRGSKTATLLVGQQVWGGGSARQCCSHLLNNSQLQLPPCPHTPHQESPDNGQKPM